MPVRKRGKTWHYEFMMHGKRYYGAIPGARNRTEAKVAESDARHRVFSGRYGRQQCNVLLAEYAQKEYMIWARENKKSWRSDVFHVQVIVHYFANKKLTDLTPLLLERFKRDRLKTPTRAGKDRQPGSVNRELACLSRILRLAVRDKLIGSNPCTETRKLREPSGRIRYLTDDEEARLLAQLTGKRAHLYDPVLFALNTGCRKGELLGLRKEWLDLGQRWVRFTDTKSGKDRIVPLNEAALEAAERVLAHYPQSDYVFPNPRSRERMLDLKHGFAGAVRDAGIENFHFHDLRHTFATRLGAAGVDAFTLKDLLGHADLRMTSRYAHATELNRLRAVDLLRQDSGNVLPMTAKGVAG